MTKRSTTNVLSLFNTDVLPFGQVYFQNHPPNIFIYLLIYFYYYYFDVVVAIPSLRSLKLRVPTTGVEPMTFWLLDQ